MLRISNIKKIIQEKSDELERVNKELEEANQKLEKLSQTDSLTGIFNRSVFDRTIRAEWDRCKRHHSPLSLIMVDIDIFKAYNDNYGHQAGDDCIRWVAQSLRACVKRSSDIVARYGGDEFAVILPHVNRDTAVQFADQIRKKVLELAIPHPFSPVSPYLTISAGVQTLIPSDELSIEKLIRTADQALYEAKKEHNEVVGI
ncbi:GGDEF domain-containing protein, partial [Syntrophaceticus schinkii]|uniref:Putative membrane-bound protein with a GGDEF domain n=1 Tax=Syntrophaceticus schinkii TaxID=499207 RepID=A0A0B7MIP4_9FIRM